jgi:O-antigen ligase
MARSKEGRAMEMTREQRSHYSQTAAFQALSLVVLHLFVFSGMLKWLPWPLDPTLLFGVLLAVACTWRVIAGYAWLPLSVVPAVIANVLFLLFYASTALYTVSPDYWRTKIATIALALLALLSPLVLVRSARDLRISILVLQVLAWAAASGVMWAYSAGYILVVSEGLGRQETKLPDYLTLGYLIGLGVLSTFGGRGLWTHATRIVCLGGLLLLPGRGPFVIALVLLAAMWALSFGTAMAAKSSRLSILLYGLGLSLALTFWGGAESLRLRLSGSVDTYARRLETSREEEFALAYRYISGAAAFGSGIGGYGIAVHDKDENIYPHNLFLEAFAESGAIGGALFLVAMLVLVQQSYRMARASGRVLFAALFVFTLANYQKSGGFVGARDLYMYAGLILAELAIWSVSSSAARSGSVVVAE